MNNYQKGIREMNAGHERKRKYDNVADRCAKENQNEKSSFGI